MDTPKYAVLRWDDWRKVRDAAQTNTPGSIHPSVNWPHDLLVSDAEVVRKQDITSGPIFHTYANVMYTYREFAPIHMRDSLLAIADHFAEAAAEADEIRREGNAKLPD